jgi:YaiO family outer membrane protein
MTVNAAAQEETGPRLVKYLEAGAGYAHFTDGVGDGNDQTVAFILSKEATWQLRLDAGRAARWGDEGLGFGAMFTAYHNTWSFGVGAATGTGEYIFPEYVVSATIGKGFLAEGNLLASLTYAHDQSKGENYFDRIGGALTWYANNHWIYGGYFNYDMGQPGSTVTMSGGLGATWFTWQERYIGVTLQYGDVNYTQVGVTDFLVGYQEFLIRGTYSEYINPTMGLNFRAEYSTNEMWDMYGISASIFKEW